MGVYEVHIYSNIAKILRQWVKMLEVYGLLECEMWGAWEESERQEGRDSSELNDSKSKDE